MNTLNYNEIKKQYLAFHKLDSLAKNLNKSFYEVCFSIENGHDSEAKSRLLPYVKLAKEGGYYV
jgi:hypothetical protein